MAWKPVDAACALIGFLMLFVVILMEIVRGVPPHGGSIIAAVAAILISRGYVDARIRGQTAPATSNDRPDHGQQREAKD